MLTLCMQVPCWSFVLLILSRNRLTLKISFAAKNRFQCWKIHHWWFLCSQVFVTKVKVKYKFFSFIVRVILQCNYSSFLLVFIRKELNISLAGWHHYKVCLGLKCCDTIIQSLQLSIHIDAELRVSLAFDGQIHPSASKDRCEKQTFTTCTAGWYCPAPLSWAHRQWRWSPGWPAGPRTHWRTAACHCSCPSG